MRQYYDVYCLLEDSTVQKFIGTPEYIEHKKKRFPTADLEVPIAKNEAFLLNNPSIKADFIIKRYKETTALYYNGQPDFDVLLERIKANIDRL